jgi:hypothetical protein
MKTDDTVNVRVGYYVLYTAARGYVLITAGAVDRDYLPMPYADNRKIKVKRDRVLMSKTKSRET